MNNAFSKQIKDILKSSRDEAIRLNSATITPEHLLLGILKEQNSYAYSIIAKMGVPTDKLTAYLEAELIDDENDDAVIDGSSDIVASPEVSEVLCKTLAEAKKHHAQVADSQHLLLALTASTDNCYASKILERMDVNYFNIDDFIEHNDFSTNSDDKTVADPKDGADFADDDEEDDDEQLSHFDNGDSASSSSSKASTARRTTTSRPDTPVLDKYGKDLTKEAESGKLDPVIGRDREIERLSQILSRRKKNNPVLIGEPGVGKSAIVEGLAIRICQRKVARILQNKHIYALDMASVVAGTKYRGQFEERIKAIIDELAKNPDIILFIDEIHTIVGAGNASGSMDAANLLKPALARGEIQCIGATTLDEYRKNIEKDGALERRFQKIIVEPTSTEETLEILRKIKEKYEEHHGVTYTEKALEACVSLTDRYISDRQFPDKAIDALDEAGSRIHITMDEVPSEIEDIEAQIREAQSNQDKAASAQNFESATRYRDLKYSLINRLEEAKKNWEKEMGKRRETIDEQSVAEVVAMMTGVPVQRIAQSEGMRLLNMDSEIKNQIIGQDEAIDKIAKAIKRNRVGLKDPNRPIGSFMFLGPTGVGKTLLAKRLAEYLFNSPDALIRIDMSEYMEKFNVSRLVGAPPGYVGYEEGGQLTEKVRRRPYSVVLLDEIEKAHADVFNMLLQVLDEGCLTDSLGRKIDFKNTIIIMTSNIGSRELKDFGAGVGFNTAITKERSESVVRKALNKKFSPEFLNRVDDIIMFNSLSKDNIMSIIDIELAKFDKRVAELGYKLEITTEAKRFVANKGYDSQYGARPLNRAIQTYIEDPLSELMLQGDAKPGNTLVIDVSGDEIKASLKE